jgi:predicted CXXCH cytochrome family protein
MNALADETTVKGDFSAGGALSYQGGRAAFFREAGGYRMRLERGDTRRLYEVTQTIGSRYFQYYVGKQVEGPEPAGHHFYAKEHVLPFGYWLDEQEWVPVVHIGPERRDGERPDAFDPPASGLHYAEYAASCNYCHTTFPLGDLLARRPQQMGEHAPRTLHWSVRKYLESAHPAEMKAIAETPPQGGGRNPLADWDAPHYAVALGVSCEACHLGSRRHAESRGRVKPAFFPQSPQLFVEAPGEELDVGRTHDNVNWACGRCHTGDRPTFAAGMSTWNSVEYSDAMRGSCYSKARCVDCHNPHKPIGPRWSATPDQDDALCLKCHAKFEPAPARVRHTHHPMGSEGARCMNCHMPRINESLEDVVRTHMIYSPTRADMIEANHPNACNLCHTGRPIDWTLSWLKQWYGARYDEKKIAANYPARAGPVGPGWLNSDNEAVRLVGADALVRARDAQALPQLLRALDDPYLLNRQFAARRLREMLNVRLSEFGYRFYMSAAERQKPLADLRAKYAPAKAP